MGLRRSGQKAALMTSGIRWSMSLLEVDACFVGMDVDGCMSVFVPVSSGDV